MPHQVLDSIFLSSLPDEQLYASPRPIYHILLIPGNPGLIGYYESFLSALSDELSSRLGSVTGGDFATRPHFMIYGQSLGGFELGQDVLPTALNPPLGLKDQVLHMTYLLCALNGNIGGDDQSAQTNRRPRIRQQDKIILIGHSVGAYIMLEVLSQIQSGASMLVSYSARYKPENEDSKAFQPRVVGGIGLFPTIVDIIASPNGQRLGWILLMSRTAAIGSALARFLAVLVPLQWLYQLVAFITGFPPDAAATTTAFIAGRGYKGRNGVRQALHMARDEMKEITADRWADDVWGSATAVDKPFRQTPPRLFFYFGKDDHWVADRTRDKLLTSRGQTGAAGEEWKPRMEVDDLGIPHGFCIRHSAPVARKVATYIQDIIQKDRSGPVSSDQDST